ncbi:hypothetical protein [Nocardioides alcanivorans]|uniref:hypothetical protein n=1 Tax=Nocardioides alcanivorans TaxID=2897352 RepID=UPI001F3F67F1|nr:hypothetical protein [Nocardioides alcanivorans]
MTGKRAPEKVPAELVLLVFVRDGKALLLRGPHDRVASLPHEVIRSGETSKEAGRRFAKNLLGVDVKVKVVGEYRMTLGDLGARRVAVVTARTLEDLGATTHGEMFEWHSVGVGAEKNTVSASFSNEVALTALRDEVETRGGAYRGPTPWTPVRRASLWLLGLGALVGAVFLGIDIGVFWDHHRLTTIDVHKAYEYGYFGERYGREFPRPPRGIEGLMYSAVMVPWMVGVGVAWVFVRQARLARVRGYGWMLAGLVFTGTRSSTTVTRGSPCSPPGSPWPACWPVSLLVSVDEREPPLRRWSSLSRPLAPPTPGGRACRDPSRRPPRWSSLYSVGRACRDLVPAARQPGWWLSTG